MRFVVTLTGGLLAWSVVGNLGLGERFYVPRNLVLTAALLGIAARSGHRPAELGLARADVRRGARWGAGSVAIVAAAVGAGVALADRIPTVAALLDDDRADLEAGAVWWVVLVRIPIGTVLFEEVAFRGVLRAASVRALDARAARLWTSAVFGLWHVPPTIVALRINDVAPASPAGLRAIAAAVVVTAAAGVLFDLLRSRSGSLLAPAAAHWGTNALGLLAAAATR